MLFKLLGVDSKGSVCNSLLTGHVGNYDSAVDSNLVSSNSEGTVLLNVALEIQIFHFLYEKKIIFTYFPSIKQNT